MRRFLISILSISVFIICLIPSISLAQNSTEGTELNYSGIVQCDGVVTDGEKGRDVKCDFYNLMIIVNKLINWAFALSVPVVAGMFAYAGYLHISGSEGDLKKSKAMMQNAVIGFIISLTAWFAVTTLVNWIKKPTFTGVDTFTNLK